MRHIPSTAIASLLLLLLPVGTRAQIVIFQEGFEPGWTPTGWIISNLFNDGTWEIDTDTVHSGAGALQLNGSPSGGNYYFTYDVDVGVPAQHIGHPGP